MYEQKSILPFLSLRCHNPIMINEFEVQTWKLVPRKYLHFPVQKFPVWRESPP